MLKLVLVSLCVGFIVAWAITSIADYMGALKRDREDLAYRSKTYRIYIVQGLEGIQSVATFNGGKDWAAYNKAGVPLGDAKKMVGQQRLMEVVGKGLEIKPETKAFWPNSPGSVREKIDWYNKKFGEKNGWTSFGNYGSYHLFSVDRHQNWVAVGEKGEILGEAEKVFPGLVANNKGWDELIAYAEKNGPVKLNDPRGVEALKNAGLAVVHAK